MSGPPCCPGNTAESIFFLSSSVHRINPERGPPRVVVHGRGNHVGVRHRVGVQTSRHQTGEMSHINPQVGADLIGYLTEFANTAGGGMPTTRR